MLLDDILKFWPVAATLGGLVMAGVLWRFRGEFATKTDLAALRTETAATAQRVERIERDLQHLPTREDIHGLRIEVTEMRGELREMRAEGRGLRDIMARTEAALTRHEDIISAAARGRPA